MIECKCGSSGFSSQYWPSRGMFDHYGICVDCRGKVEMESIPSTNVVGRYFIRKARPEERTAAHPANRPGEYVETSPGFYEHTVAA